MTIHRKGRDRALIVLGMLLGVGGWLVPQAGAEQDPAAGSPRGAAQPRAARVILVSDAVGDPGFTPDTAADSPTESSGAFDSPRGDLGSDADLAKPTARGRRRRLPPGAPSPADRLPDPLAGTPRIDPDATGIDAERAIATMLPPRTDTPGDWLAPLDPLHECGEPRALPPCVPPPPCHPADPPAPYDLVGVRGVASRGPIYRGPCAPRAATKHEGPWGWLHALHDRCVDAFYTPR